MSCSASSKIPRPIVSAQTHPEHLAVDLTDVYWTASSGAGTSVFKTLKDDEQPSVQVASVSGAVHGIAVDADGLFMIVRGPHATSPDVIRKISHKKKPFDVVKSPSKVTSLALDATHLYWTQGEGPGADADETRSAGVLRVMRSGGTPLNLVVRQQGLPCSLALSATHVFWVNAEAGKRNVILSVRKAGGQPVTLAELPDPDAHGSAPELAADDFAVYYKTRTTIAKVPADGGAPLTLATVADSDVAPLAIDAHHLYFQLPGSLQRIPLLGGVPSQVAAAAARSVAVDERAIYWLTGDAVMRISKH